MRHVALVEEQRGRIAVRKDQHVQEAKKLQYMRHLVRIASADKQLRPTEDLFLEEARKAIGASKAILKQAIESPGELDFAAVARLSDRVRNLEDMLDLVLSDGELSDGEKSEFVTGAKQAGLTQELVNVMLAEARGRRKQQSGKCPQCGAENAAGAKFCSSCGGSIAGPAEVGRRVELDIPAAGVTLAFAESSSAKFSEALSRAAERQRPLGRWRSGFP